jgi:hypothetical protein
MSDSDELIWVTSQLLRVFFSGEKEVKLIFNSEEAAESFFDQVKEAIQHLQWRLGNQ